MNANGTTNGPPSAKMTTDFDAIVIGAGISGMFQLYRLRELGMRVRVFEAGSGVGGTWYWNRYPGARFDSESYSYAYSFSQELLNEWDWTEHFAPQPETERYLNYVADKFALKADIQFSCRVIAAHYDGEHCVWVVSTNDCKRLTSRFLITAVGPLSAPTLPRIPNIDDFEGLAFHTGLWPKEPVDFSGKRVAVVGTGASGVQAIPEIAKKAFHLTVFQRRPNWCTPLHNRPIGPQEMADIRAGYPQLFQRCLETAACFIHTTDPRGTFEVSEEERLAFWEELYETPGFGIWQGNFRDMLTDRRANELVSAFVADKIRQRVRDPNIAERLIPQDHGFGTRRVPQETGYFETYNRPNVELVSILEAPIERITPSGIQTNTTHYAFDIIVYATGFDAITGSLDRIDIRGMGGEKLIDKWSGGPKTFLGVMVHNFPNMFMLVGPHTALGNIPRSIEYNVDWVRDLIHFMSKKRYSTANARPRAVAEWTRFVADKADGLLTNEVDSWMTGVNMNVEGKQTRVLARYSGSAPEYRAWCDRVAAAGYTEICFH
ncbi:MAG: flavin-containing monooxygenase [Hyphomicrobiaceae bacterium]